MSRSPVLHPDQRSEERSIPEEAINHGNNLFISGLSSYVDEADLQDAFGKFGTVNFNPNLLLSSLKRFKS
jgi:RNA recognition motif-containing protein